MFTPRKDLIMVATDYIVLLSISVIALHCTSLFQSDMKTGLLSTEMPKYWFNYVRKLLHRDIKLIFEYYKKQKYFDFHFIPLSIERTQIFKQSVTNIIQFKQNCRKKRWKKMEKGIVKTTSVKVNYIVPCKEKVMNIWTFKLHKLYRINITFDHLSFSMSYHHSCDFGSMVISSAAKVKIEYCGIHSEIRIFPPNTNVTINFTVGRLTKFSTIFFHSIMDSNNVITIPNLKHDLSNINRWTICFLKTHVYLQKFMLRVNTYQYLVINVTGCRNCSVKILDGPDFISPSLKPFYFQGNHNNYQLYLISSFQCVIYVYHYNEITINEIFQHSSGRMKSEKNVLISPFKNVSHFTFPNNQYCSHRNVCMIRFQTNVGYRLNVSMRSMYNTDQDDILCSYAGLSMYDIINQSYMDIDTICQPTKRNIYSNMSRMLLVYYSFTKYSSFRVELIFSTTMCKMVELNLCTLFTNYDLHPHFQVVLRRDWALPLIQIKNLGCTVYQLTANTSVRMYKQKYDKYDESSNQEETRYRAEIALIHKEFVGKTADIYLAGSLRGKIIKYQFYFDDLKALIDFM